MEIFRKTGISRFRAAIGILMAASFVYACGNPDESKQRQQINTTPIPTTLLANAANTSPLDTILINGHSPIVFQFTNSVDRNSLALSGTMASEADVVEWSTVINTDDTITIRPRNSWVDGSGTLTIDAIEWDGITTVHLERTFIVDAIAPNIAAQNVTDNAIIISSAPLVFTFSEEMAPDSLHLTGTLAAYSNLGLWSSDHLTLTVSPTTVWPDGVGNLAIETTDLAGNALQSSFNLSITVDSSAPTFTSVPGNGSTALPSVDLQFFFSEALKPTSLVISGSLATSVGSMTWNGTQTVNDTLTLRPLSSWPTGAQNLKFTVNDVAGNTLTATVNYIFDNTPPTASTVPSNNKLLGNTQKILIRFSDSMNKNTVAVGGSLVSVEYTAVWSKFIVENDTLTLLPVTSWTLGAKQSLIINGENIVGLAMSPATTNAFDVVEPVIYVSTTGSDANVGIDPYAPKRNIPAAISAVSVNFGGGEVRVASGTYSYNGSSASARIAVKSGISLFGGYSTDFSTRDAVAYLTILKDSNLSTTTTSTQTLLVPADVTDKTVIDGFTINGASYGKSTSAVTISSLGGITLSNNRINGGSGSDYNYGVFGAGSNGVVVSNNTITAGSGTPYYYSAGLYLSNQAKVIGNSIINRRSGDGFYFTGKGGNVVLTGNQITTAGGASYCAATIQGGATITRNQLSATSNGFGLCLRDSNSGTFDVNNNLIAGTGGVDVSATITSAALRNNIVFFTNYGINNYAATLNVDNNIFHGDAASANTVAIRSTKALSSLNHNDIFAVVTYYLDSATSLRTNTLLDLNSFSNASANQSLDPMFINLGGSDNNPKTLSDNNWHFQADAPTVITQGGLNGLEQTPPWGYDTDFDGIARPAAGMAWSIGAFNY